MGIIREVKPIDNGVEFLVALSTQESLILNGHHHNILMVSEECAHVSMNVLCRGRGNTKYLRIPSKIAKGISTQNNVRGMRIDTADKVMFYVVIDK